MFFLKALLVVGGLSYFDSSPSFATSINLNLTSKDLLEIQLFSNKNTTIFDVTTNKSTHIKVNPQRKLKRKSARRKLGISRSAYSRNSTITSRKRLLRRKRIRNKKKQKIDGNILEITTARGILVSRRKQSNETINELIQKLNRNPEDNFDEYKNHKKPFGVIKNTAGTKIVNRCSKNRGGCAHVCHPKGKTKCSCLKGFYIGSDQKSCLDIDECKFNNGECETECINLIGSYTCRCPEGLTLTDDKLSCEDINECLLRNGHGPCQDTCRNIIGSYRCSCEGLNGTQLGKDGRSCDDINECLENNGGCSHTCINTIGTSFCSCPIGMELSADWKSCQDINECETQEIRDSCTNCVNTEGSYVCLDMQRDQSSPSNVACKPIFPPARGFIDCNRENAFSLVNKKGRKRVINSPGTVCKLVCPTGYRLLGEYYVLCGFDGEWSGSKVGKCVGASPPTLVCPPTQYATIIDSSNKVLVKFPSPVTNVHWNYVRSYPSRAKDLRGLFTEGVHIINFMAKDPNTKLLSTCHFKIIVKSD